MAARLLFTDSMSIRLLRASGRPQIAVIATVFLGCWTSFGFAQEATKAKFHTVAKLAAFRLDISEGEAAKRLVILEQLHAEEFDKFARSMDEWISAMVLHLAEYDRRATAVARGISAEGDKTLDDTKSRMKNHEDNLRTRSGAFLDIRRQWIVSRTLTANVIGSLPVNSLAESKERSAADSHVKVDVDELGIEESILRLKKWRSELEENAIAMDERLQEVLLRMAMPEGYFEYKLPLEKKALAMLLRDQVLKDVDMSESDFKAVLELCCRSKLTDAAKALRWRDSRDSSAWTPNPEDSSGEYALIQSLRTKYADAKKIDKPAAADDALEAIKSELRKRVTELHAFEAKVDRAKALELEGIVYVMMWESRGEIFELLKAGKKSDPEQDRAATIDWKNDAPAQVVADTVPHIQELAQMVRRYREVWLR